MIRDIRLEEYICTLENRVDELKEDVRTLDSVIEELHGIEGFVAPGEYARFLEESPTIREVIS